MPRLLGARRAGTLALLAALLVGPLAAAAPAQAAPAAPASPSYTWHWSDGSRDTERSFLQTQYRTQAGLPRLVVELASAAVVPVYLQFFQDGAWNTESIVPTSARGVALVAIDPFCEGGGWCDGAYRYRIKVGTQITALAIDYYRD